MSVSNISDENINEDIPNRIELVKSGKRTYIYQCTKEELQEILKEENISYKVNANIDSLRKLVSEYYKSKGESRHKQVIKMSICGEIKPYDGQNLEVFLQQLECFIVLNDIPVTKKVPLLITKLSPPVFETLTYLCAPKTPLRLSFEELCKILKDKYSKPLPTALERLQFRKRNQLSQETIEEYVLQLRKLATKCNFKDMDDQIKEKFIEGVSSKLIKFELMKTNTEMSLEDCVEVGRTVEAALLQTNGSTAVTENTFFYQQRSQERGLKQKQNRYSKSIPNIKCYCCGKNNHTKANCRLKNKYCSECGKQGHIFKMCTKNRQVNIVDSTDIDNHLEEPEGDIKTLFEDHKTYSVNVSRIPPYYLTMNVNGFDLPFQLDTGSDVTVMSLHDKKMYFDTLELKPCTALFRNFDQSVSQPLGKLINLSVTYNDLTKKLDIFVVKNNVPRIIGRDWLNEICLWPPTITKTFNIATNLIQNVSDAQQLIRKQFAEVFSQGWGNFKGEVITLKLKQGATPRCLPVRRVPFSLREKVNNEINRLLSNGRISTVEHCEWGTPVVPILKPDGSVRLCGDYKLTVNPCLEIDHFPLPHIDDILNTLRQGEYYCELDLKEAYLQAPLSPESQSCTTIVTEVGTFKYNYLPYGVSSGPGAFQRLMVKRLNNIPNVIVFIDNIYIQGRNLQQTYDTLCQVLSKLQESEFKLKPEKCKFFTTSLNVFGFQVNKNGISVLQSNVQPLLNAKSPTNLTLLKSFLGKINYYSRFLKNMASILTPLYECTKKDKFKWTSDCENAFQLIKKKISSMSKLYHYDPQLAVILTCDASDTGLGAVLSNRDKYGIVKPIAFASKKLNDVEQKYATIDKEALAIIFGISKFYNYIYGRSFELETDNAALVRIFGPTKSIPKMAAKRLQHYAIFLSAFNYIVRHIQSNRNPADFLSRTAELEQNLDIKDMHSLLTSENFSNVNYINEASTELLNWKNIQLESKKDKELSKIMRYIIDGWPDRKLLDKEVLPFYNRKEELSLDRECIFWGYRIVVPNSIRQTVLIELHKSHFGIVRMKEIARSYFWWPKLDSEIDNITKNCLVCLQNSKTPTQTQKPWPMPPSAWYRIHADFLGPFYNKMFMVIVDSYSKWPEVYEMTNITSSRTIEIFKNLFTRFGYPVHLVTDNGRTFTSQEFLDFCKLNQIKHTFTPPYHPATNGAAERFVETFKSAITKIKESGYNLSSAVRLFLFDYRSTPQRATGVSPARLMLGREIRNRFSFLRPPPMSEVIQAKVPNGKQGHREIKFEVGEKVMVKDYRKGSKSWVQGVIIEESVPGVSYFIDVEGLKWKRHVNQMLSCSQTLEAT